MFILVQPWLSCDLKNHLIMMTMPVIVRMIIVCVSRNVCCCCRPNAGMRCNTSWHLMLVWLRYFNLPCSLFWMSYILVQRTCAWHVVCACFSGLNTRDEKILARSDSTFLPWILVCLKTLQMYLFIKVNNGLLIVFFLGNMNGQTGTCAAKAESLNSQHKYFSKALELYQKFDLNR